MVAVLRSKTVVSRDNLNKQLEEFGVRLSDTGLFEVTEYADRDGMKEIGRFLLRTTKEQTLWGIWGLGGWWYSLRGEAYGDRTALLREMVGEAALLSVRKRIGSYATVYARWLPHGGIQSRHWWTWHREHGKDENGQLRRLVPTAAAKTRVLECSRVLRLRGEPEDLTAWRMAVDALIHMSDDADDSEPD